jgi:hypothetical protein
VHPVPDATTWMFVSPDFAVDLELLDLVRLRDFRHLERETKRNYATDILLLLTFLSSRRARWKAAAERDLGDYRGLAVPRSGEPAAGRQVEMEPGGCRVHQAAQLGGGAAATGGRVPGRRPRRGLG